MSKGTVRNSSTNSQFGARHCLHSGRHREAETWIVLVSFAAPWPKSRNKFASEYSSTCLSTQGSRGAFVAISSPRPGESLKRASQTENLGGCRPAAQLRGVRLLSRHSRDGKEVALSPLPCVVCGIWLGPGLASSRNLSQAQKSSKFRSGRGLQKQLQNPLLTSRLGRKEAASN